MLAPLLAVFKTGPVSKPVLYLYPSTHESPFHINGLRDRTVFIYLHIYILKYGVASAVSARARAHQHCQSDQPGCFGGGFIGTSHAIRKSGSDTITEMKLASFLGRNIIDPAMKLHFREAVSKSDQSVISRYIDIILESGSGPTVQEAMKNPALFSMVIQLSGLAFAHEHEPLAGAIVEAMERIVRESGADVAIVPDYVALLGTLRACQEQTAGFRWASVFEAVEHKIQKTPTASANEGSQTERRAKRRKLDPELILDTMTPPGIGARCLPFPVMQALLMWLHSLQKFPEHRLLHLTCNTGVSTIVVWCYHVLGLSVKVDLRGTSTCFGKEPSNVLIEVGSSRDVGASLMDPAEQHEPLFRLAKADDDPEIAYQNRAEAYGFGQLVLKAAGLSGREKQYCSEWIIARSMKKSGKQKGFYNYPSEDSMIRAGKFLFGLETVDVEALRKHTGGSFTKSKRVSSILWPRLAALLITFARIQEHDLERCNSMPLSLSAYHLYRGPDADVTSNFFSRSEFLNPSMAFQFLAYLLSGHRLSKEYVADAVLISASGWSIFFDIFDVADPSDVSNTIRVMGGVPSRRGVRRARIIDGPTDNTLPSKVVHNKPEIAFAPGVSTGKRGITMVGYHSDAFKITQIFTWTPEDKTVHGIQKFGFRQMQELCHKTKRVPSCECGPISSNVVKQLDAYDGEKRFNDEFLFYSMLLLPSFYPSSSSERLMARKDLNKHRGAVYQHDYFFYVSDNTAARWLELQSLCAALKKEDHPPVIVRGFDTCLDCAMAYPKSSNYPHRILL